MTLITLAICLCISALTMNAEPVSFNDRCSVDWKINNGEITFTIVANATGWIGLGFGPKKHMKGADLVIGGVKNGKGYLYDLHGTDDDTPVQDQQENYYLLEATETAGQTILKFKRKLDTGDKEDVALTGPVYLLWAFSPEDASEKNLSYHGNDRGHENDKRTFS